MSKSLISFLEPFRTSPANWVSTESVGMSTLSQRGWSSEPGTQRLLWSTYRNPPHQIICKGAMLVGPTLVEAFSAVGMINLKGRL